MVGGIRTWSDRSENPHPDKGRKDK
jgi:hypothetical protein